MAVDAERRQSQIIFGRLPYQTSAFIECDETCVFSWKEVDEETVTYHWFVYFGIVERGSHKLWLKMMPLRTSVNEPRIPQIGQDAYRTALDEAGFDSRTRAVMFSDSAPAFVHTGHPGIVDAAQVNHSEQEFTKSVEVLWRPPEMRNALCHTQTIDRAWRSLKDDIPNGVSGRTPAGRQCFDAYVRQQQWYYMTSGKDRWPEFCNAVHHFRKYFEELDAASKKDGTDEQLPNVGVLAGTAGTSAGEAGGRESAGAMGGSTGESTAGLLGERQPFVPPEVHGRMEELARQNVIPRTTTEQRERAKPTSGSQYGVPEFLKEADKTWVLEVKGGSAVVEGNSSSRVHIMPIRFAVRFGQCLDPPKFCAHRGGFSRRGVAGLFVALVACLPGSTRIVSVLRRPEFLIDVYCGVGLFALAGSALFDLTFGIEVDKNAVALAKENAKLNGISNATFIRGDARKGLAEKFHFRPFLRNTFIPGVSCDPATQASGAIKRREITLKVEVCPVSLQMSARDLGKLHAAGYKPQAVRNVAKRAVRNLGGIVGEEVALTVQDFKEKGAVGAVKDAVADAGDILIDGVSGIVGWLRGEPPQEEETQASEDAQKVLANGPRGAAYGISQASPSGGINAVWVMPEEADAATMAELARSSKAAPQNLNPPYAPSNIQPYQPAPGSRAAAQAPQMPPAMPQYLPNGIQIAPYQPNAPGARGPPGAFPGLAMPYADPRGVHEQNLEKLLALIAANPEKFVKFVESQRDNTLCCLDGFSYLQFNRNLSQHIVTLFLMAYPQSKVK
ncbi:unnamed protein product [Symbiodinium sp. CCMP2592]|nr:unnamed protein product [Symbiodinium sp. CCMP2592]